MLWRLSVQSQSSELVISEAISSVIIQLFLEMFAVWSNPQYHIDSSADILEALLIVPVYLQEDTVPSTLLAVLNWKAIRKSAQNMTFSEICCCFDIVKIIVKKPLSASFFFFSSSENTVRSKTNSCISYGQVCDCFYEL